MTEIQYNVELICESVSNFIWLIHSREMWWEWHVKCLCEGKKFYKLMWEPEVN